LTPDTGAFYADIVPVVILLTCSSVGCFPSIANDIGISGDVRYTRCGQFDALIVPSLILLVPVSVGCFTIDRQLDIGITGDVQPDAVTFDAAIVPVVILLVLVSRLLCHRSPATSE
jgi:hypothetical protein